MAGKFELNKGKTGKFSFNLKAGNGQIVFTSQSYDSKRSATAGINSVRKNSQKDARFERKESSKKQPYFVMTAANGQVIGKSQMYANAVSMEKGIQSVARNAPDAPLVDLSEVTAEKKKPAAKKTSAGKGSAAKTTVKKKAGDAKAAVKKKAAAAPKAAAKTAAKAGAVAGKAAAAAKKAAPAKKKAAKNKA